MTRMAGMDDGVLALQDVGSNVDGIDTVVVVRSGSAGPDADCDILRGRKACAA